MHKGQLPRLNRAIGQLGGIKKMLEEERYCIDIVLQLKSVQAALRKIEEGILAEHLGHCVAEAMDLPTPEQRREKVDELVRVMGARP